MSGTTPGLYRFKVGDFDVTVLGDGDSLVTQHTHFEHPDWHLALDLEQEQGARTRRRLLDRIATDRLLIQGFHLPFPGVGHAVRHGNAYRWVPAV